MTALLLALALNFYQPPNKGLVPLQFSWEYPMLPVPSEITFNLYGGPANKPITSCVLLTNVPTIGITMLADPASQFFCTATNSANGAESGPSNVVNYTPPAPANLKVSKPVDPSSK